MKLSQSLLVGMCGAAIAVALLRMANLAGSAELRLASQPAFDRVMKTHALRCIAGTPPPAFGAIDLERDIRRGMAKTIIEQMGRILDLQIEWTGDVAADKIAADLAAGKDDAYCLPLWPTGPLAGGLDFTVPLDYVPVYAYARAGDARFDGDLAKIDDKNVTIAVTGGGMGKTIALEDFPQAAQYEITDVIDKTHMLLAVTTRRADVAFADAYVGDDFIKNNPGVLKQVAGAPPVRVFPETFAVAKGEDKLRDMLNVALRQMQNSGFIKAALDNYLGDHKGEFFYAARPWE
jgi:ABC-type amino acid transport substrate-binding protein